MHLFRTPHLIVFVLLVFVLAGCGGGGGEGGRDEPLAAPQYDLTGLWRTVDPIDCAILSADLFPNEIAALKSLLESALLDSLGSRVIQTGNDLEIVSLASGLRLDATISGNQIRYAYSEERTLGEFDVDIFGEAEGTVLSANRIAVTEDATLTLEARGQRVSVGILCTSHAVRTG